MEQKMTRREMMEAGVLLVGALLRLPDGGRSGGAAFHVL